jgi:hypothetical protein
MMPKRGNNSLITIREVDSYNTALFAVNGTHHEFPPALILYPIRGISIFNLLFPILLMKYIHIPSSDAGKFISEQIPSGFEREFWFPLVPLVDYVHQIVLVALHVFLQ